MKIISRKPEIIYLLSKVIEKFERETGKTIIKNSNRKNYEPIAKLLSEISNELPNTDEKYGHEKYPVDYNPRNLEYPFRKYDITGNQVKDAYFNQIVSNPRSFLVDACYIYLYGKGRKRFEDDPDDPNLLVREVQQDMGVEKESISSPTTFKRKRKIPTALMAVSLIILLAALAISAAKWSSERNRLKSLREDMKILPYKVTQAEIDSLEGVWLCYTGSPQARISDPNRYHMIVSNVVDIKYRDGYFVFARYGASFDHEGYMQFESSWLVSIHSSIKNKEGKIESPRHSLMKLDENNIYKSVISASWNFDVGANNNIIGIREVYIKQGKGGHIEEIMNTVENASCRCKIINWHMDNNQVKVFQLKNQPLESLPEQGLRDLLNEKSILLRVPGERVVIEDTSGR